MPGASRTRDTARIGHLPGMTRTRLACLSLFCLALVAGGCGHGKKATESGRVEAETQGSAPLPASPPITVDAFLDAALQGRIDVVANALRDGMDVNAIGPGRRTALMMAAFNGDAGVAQHLLDKGARIDDLDATGRTALMYASTGPDVDTIKLLLDRGADINAVDGGERWSPLMFAAAEGHEPVIRLLLKRGADAALVDDDGDTAASFAAQRGHGAVVELLKEHAR